MSDTEKTLSWILKGGLLLTPFIVFIVAPFLFFPFITGKNFAFRVLIEVIGVIWLYGALRFPSLRPRFSPVAWAVVVFLAVMGLATVFSLSPYRSFWSGFERMEGYLGLLHLGLFFFLLISVFRTWADWQTYFYATIAASAGVVGYALLQLLGRLVIHQGGTRVDATLGNATYLAAYLLFHLFFIIWFFLRAKSHGTRVLWAGLFLLEAFILYSTATRGAFLGFMGGLVILGLLLGFTSRGAMRRAALAAITVALAMPVLFFLTKNTPLVQKSLVLQRFANISLTETTTRARFIIWGMAVKGVKERPVLGWGQESFTYLFTKHYDSRLWSQEPWFDRAHNVFLDWLSAGGILGLLAYLGMYAAAAWVLMCGFLCERVDALTLSAMGALLAAHMFQNIFVFDSLMSYLPFFALLAYAHALAPPAAGPARRLPAGVAVAATAVAVPALVFVLWAANVKPFLAAKYLLDAMKANQSHAPAGRVDAIIAPLERGIALDTFGTSEIREQATQVTADIIDDAAIAEQDRVKLATFVTQELETQRRDFPNDMRAKAFLANLYTVTGRSADAIAAVNELFAISDRRQNFYFIAAEAYLKAGQPDQAIVILKQAYDLDPAYNEALVNLAVALISSGREAESEAFLFQRYGVRYLTDQQFITAYLRRGRLDRAIEISEKLVAGDPGGAERRANLGVLYARVGRTADAVRELREAIRLEPQFRARGEDIIRQVEAGALGGR